MILRLIYKKTFFLLLIIFFFLFIKNALSSNSSTIILKIDNDPSLLDIGSGRGEWIQKCTEMGLKAIGIELNSNMVKDCRNLNLNVQEGDALSLLDDFCEDSFSIVSAFHVIEHMEHEKIKEILIKAKRILKWQPKTSFKKLVKDMVESDIKFVKKSGY